MSEIEWREPPPGTGSGRRNSQVHQERAEALRARPGEWAVVKRGPLTAIGNEASAIKSGRYAAYRPQGSFEARSLQDGDECALYVRYVGVVSA